MTMMVECRRCGKQFSVKPSQAARRAYCSRDCIRGWPSTAAYIVQPSDKLCAIPDCPRLVKCKGLCDAHYTRKKRGQPLGGPVAPTSLRYCRVPNCGRRAVVRGMCSGHEHRWRNGKPMDPPIQARSEHAPRKKHTGSYVDPDGYVIVTVDGRGRREHRLVFEGLIGRPLLKHENVHHKNGVRHDNRPENLELWSKSQPGGQRVVDKLDWAREILALYAPVEAVLRARRARPSRQATLF